MNYPYMNLFFTGQMNVLYTDKNFGVYRLLTKTKDAITKE